MCKNKNKILKCQNQVAFVGPFDPKEKGDLNLNGEPADDEEEGEFGGVDEPVELAEVGSPRLLWRLNGMRSWSFFR